MTIAKTEYLRPGDWVFIGVPFVIVEVCGVERDAIYCRWPDFQGFYVHSLRRDKVICVAGDSSERLQAVASLLDWVKARR